MSNISEIEIDTDEDYKQSKPTIEKEPVTKTIVAQELISQQIFKKRSDFNKSNKKAEVNEQALKTFLNGAVDYIHTSHQSLDSSRAWICFWVIHALDLLGDLDSRLNELTPRTITFLEKLQNKSRGGGFAGGIDQESHVVSTFAAVNALLALNSEQAYKVIDRESMYRFLLAMKTDHGSFRTQADGEDDSRSTYCAVVIASLLDIATPRLMSGVAEYLAACQTYEGGFGGTPKNEAHGGYTYCAVAALSLLKRFDLIDVESLLRWLVNRQPEYDGGLQGRSNKLVDTCYTFWQGAAFPIVQSHLGSVAQQNIGNQQIGKQLFNQLELQNYCLVCCQDKRGGFSDHPEKGRDYYHTCYTLSGLSISQHNDIHLAVSSINDTVQEMPKFTSEDVTQLEGGLVLQPTHPIYNLTLVLLLSINDDVFVLAKTTSRANNIHNHNGHNNGNIIYQDGSETPSDNCPTYSLSNLTPTSYGYTAALSLVTPGPYGDDVKQLQLYVYFQTQQILRVKIIDPATQRWEVPFVNQMHHPTRKPSLIDYNIKFALKSFGFSITRVSNGEVLFNTAPPSDCSTNGLIYEDHYLELTTRFQTENPNLYGLGERVAPLRLQNNFTYTLFAKDQGTPVNLNLYGSHPFYMELNQESGNAFGVFLLNSNAMDVVIAPKTLTYKVTGGILDFFFFMGPSPVEVIQQYTQVIGTPYMPSYWSLGWHQCRWGYKSVNESKEVVLNYAKYGIPLETMWNDIDYMDRYEDFTLDPVNYPESEMTAYVDWLHSNNQHYIMIVDPGIHTNDTYEPYSQLTNIEGFIKASDGTPFVGVVWPGSTIFPDFFNPKTNIFWKNWLQTFQETVAYDGVWIDMNEVSNFCNGNCNGDNGKMSGFDPNNPPYLPGGISLDKHTINLTTTQYGNLSVFDTHNLYGYTESLATVDAVIEILQKRATVVTRSTFPGSGNHAAHWLGDNNSQYSDMYYSIPGILNMNMFGIPLVGADICGFSGNTTAELCGRWMQLGNFYPFSRNHNDKTANSQEPYVFNDTVTSIAIAAIHTKYTLLPFYYTLFYLSHVLGDPVVRPLFFEYPTDANTLAIDQQFLVGECLLVSPVLEEGATTVNAYFPDDIWYNYFTGVLQPGGKNVTLPAPFEVINVHLRGGYIIPTQPTASYEIPAGGIPITTAIARTLPYHLIVAVGDSTSYGELYLDDGITVDAFESGNYTQVNFFLQETQPLQYEFTSTVTHNNYVTPNLVETIIVYGSNKVSQVTINDQPYDSFVYNTQNQTLSITNLTLQISSSFIVRWS
ncbi:alpha-glucosidase [Heterostelium album PN500]|uniref:Protein farnesyltransferase subunit beta n=1 Tax=Heterostelium pallidum (strain ATCC 26659 / Pp 5 / PN500) TaxID=670386 RepID=D3BIK5_HETP5|nr:alpha-glucosidase [Heterostelium album PN500]EFA78629.1 alpha-glucosidase [Heterostelium album PN500]|eukprot:XP_020430753.1 alpha-glucosidase [Heterostelium album PN500]